MNKVQKKVVKHFRELRCDWCNKYHTIWQETPPSDKKLAKRKDSFLSPSGTQKVLYECKQVSCIRSRPEGWHQEWCDKCRKYEDTGTHKKM